MQSKCVNKKLNLQNLFLGFHSACLISEWIINKQIDVNQLLLRQNCFGDSGFEKISKAILRQSSIFYLDMAQNGLSVKCALSLFTMLRHNNTLVSLDLGSTLGGSLPNRFGKEFSLSLGRVLESNASLI